MEQKTAMKMCYDNYYHKALIFLLLAILSIHIFLSSQEAKANHFEIRNDVEIKSVIEKHKSKIPKLMKKDRLGKKSFAENLSKLGQIQSISPIFPMLR